jgi:hypothetical protein
VSQAALDYVLGDAVVKALPASEKFLLRQIAMLHDLRVNCAYANVVFLAEQTMNSPRNCRRLLASLEKRGLLSRHAIERNNGSQTSNEYELPGMRVSTAVTEQARQQVFKTSRKRRASQLSLMLGDGGDVLTTNRSDGLAVAETYANGSIGLAVATDANTGMDVVEIGGECPPPPDNCCPPPPGQQLSSLDVLLDVLSDVPLPLPLLETRSGGKTSNGKSAWSEQKLEATASAKAKATTQVLQAPEVSTESVVEASLSSGAGRESYAPGFRVSGRVIPFRKRRMDADQERAQLDGFEAALFDVTMVVLGECGIAAKNATRLQRLAVSEALRDEAERSGENLNAVAARAVNRWNLYVESSWALFRVVGVRKFFTEGYWLDKAGHPWDWDKAALAKRRSQTNAGIGMR